MSAGNTPLDLVLATAPTVSPLTLEDLRAHLRLVDDDSEDASIEAYRDAVVGHLDGPTGILGRCLVNQTWDYYLPAFPATTRLALPLAPLVSVTSVKYIDANAAEQTLASSNYRVLTGSRAEIEFIDTFSAPTLDTRARAVTVRFVAGYGAAAANVPSAIRAALKLMVGDLHAQRETFVLGDAAYRVQTSVTVDALLRPYMVMRP